MYSRLLISAVIFLLLTALKLSAPAEAGQLRELLTSQMSGHEDLAGQVLSLGSALSGEEPIYVSDTAPEGDVKAGSVDVSADFDLEKMVEGNLSGFLRKTPEPGADTDRLIEKQQAFLQLQSGFADWAVPAQVSYDIPAFSFETLCPADAAAVTSGFGYRVHPTFGDVRFHYGADYSLFDGDDILAFADGRVITVETFSGYGLTVIVDHGAGVTTLYAHCSRILVAVGDEVKMGQKIALAGHSGRATGPHLHLEVEVNGVRYNPELCF